MSFISHQMRGREKTGGFSIKRKGRSLTPCILEKKKIHRKDRSSACRVSCMQGKRKNVIIFSLVLKEKGILGKHRARKGGGR